MSGPGRRFAVLAAVLRWAMPRSRKVAAMEKHQSPKEQERNYAPELSRPGMDEAGNAVTAMEKAPTGSESQSVREVSEALSVKKEAAAAEYHAIPSRVDCGTGGDARGGRR